MLMFITISAVIGLVLFYYTYRIGSPLVYSAGFILVLGPLRIPESNPILGFLTLVIWILILAISASAYKSWNISLNNFEIRLAKKLTLRRRLIVLIVIFIIVSFWLKSRGGLVGISSGAELGWYKNIANYFFTGLSALATVFLAFSNRSSSKFFFRISLFIFCLSVIYAFLIGSRGAALWPVVLILIVRFVRARGSREFTKSVVVVAFALPLAFMGILEITAQRGGDASWQNALSNISKTASGYGNGINPRTETAILSYVEQQGAFLPEEFLLSGFYGFIPRRFWPDKPDVGVGPTVGSVVFGTGGGVIGKGAGMPVSVPVQFAASFGNMFYVVGSIFVLLIILITGRLSRRYPVLLVILINLPASMMGSDFGRIQIQAIMTLLTVMALLKLFGLSIFYIRRPAL